MTPDEKLRKWHVPALFVACCASLFGLLFWLGEDSEWWHFALLLIAFIAAIVFVEKWLFDRWWRRGAHEQNDEPDDET